MGLSKIAGVLSNGVQVCDKGHHHFSMPWTIYVVDPETAYDAKSYTRALFPIEMFDTLEQTTKLYALEAFSPPNGPPSWSMVVPGGAIAVFQGGKFGFPTVKPEWEDPAARNGGEFRFIFAHGFNPLEFVDNIFGSLVNWMAKFPHYDGASILGLFVKNVTADPKMDTHVIPAIQFRLWISEADPQVATQVTWAIAHSMAKVIAETGARGTISFRSLGELIERSKPGQTGGQPRIGSTDENSGSRKINLRLTVPVLVDNGGGDGHHNAIPDRR